MQRARGAGSIMVASDDGRTRLRTLYQEGCAKLRLPNTHDGSVQAVLINTAGGLTGGDRIDWQAEAGANARLVLTTQACERVYRSMGPDAVVETHLTAGEDARIDWLPQETILFSGSRLRRALSVDLAPSATFLAVESIILGREAMGEDARDAHLFDTWRIRVGGRLMHAEANRIDADTWSRDGLSALAGNRAFATILLIAPDAARRLDAVRALLPATTLSAASAVAGRLVIRAAAPSGLALRRIIAPILNQFSGAGSLPRLWHL
ncbi:MAG: urease accessory protein UreD [Devosia sp.]